jgi:hypothetical protein
MDSLDKYVKVWAFPECTGKIQFSHGTGVQSVAFNPITKMLASGAEADIGFYSELTPQVRKEKVAFKVVSLRFSLFLILLLNNVIIFT